MSTLADRRALPVVTLAVLFFWISGCGGQAPAPGVHPPPTEPPAPAGPAQPPPSASPEPQATAADFQDGWARAVPPNAGNTAVFLTWVHRGASPARIVGATSPSAQRVELHTHILEEGVAKMRKVEFFEAEPEVPHKLEPGGDHLMLLDLTGPIEEGGTVELMVTFADGSLRTLAVPVRAAP